VILAAITVAVGDEMEAGDGAVNIRQATPSGWRLQRAMVRGL